jgi:hypothetical protein
MLPAGCCAEYGCLGLPYGAAALLGRRIADGLNLCA